MPHRRWWVAALVVLCGAVGGLAVARSMPVTDARRGSLPGVLTVCAARPPVGPAVEAQPGTFFRLDPTLDAAGTLIGQRLVVGRDAIISAVGDVAPAGTASGPVQGTVVVVDDDGATSQLKLVSVASGCGASIYSTASVVRGAILDPVDGSVLLHLLNRADRADLGIWQLAAGASTPIRILEPLPAASGIGRVWATELRLDAAGTRLAVQSCLDVECLTRILDLADPGTPATVVRGDTQGAIVGFAGSTLVTWAACDGLPCAILGWDRATGGPRTIIDAASSAALTADGKLLVALTDTGAGDGAVVIDPVRHTVTPLHGLAPGEQPIGHGGAVTSGYEAAGSALAVAEPGGAARVIGISAAGEVLP